jgi:hypothetical protein
MMKAELYVMRCCQLKVRRNAIHVRTCYVIHTTAPQTKITISGKSQAFYHHYIDKQQEEVTYLSTNEKWSKECLYIKGRNHICSAVHGDNGGGAYVNSVERVKTFVAQKMTCLLLEETNNHEARNIDMSHTEKRIWHQTRINVKRGCGVKQELGFWQFYRFLCI